MRESNDVRKREKRKVFVERKKREVEELWRKWRDEGDEENEEEKEIVVNRWENKEAGTHLMAKLHVV